MLVGLGGGLAITFLLGRLAASKAPDPRAEHPTVDENSGEAEPAQATQARGYERPPQHLALAPSPPPAVPPAPPAAEPAMMTPEQETAKLNEAFDRDRPADEAAGNRRVAIATAFRSPAANGAALRDLDCRATRCRMAVEFTDAAADKRVLSDLFALLKSAGLETRELGFTVPIREERADGSIVATVHLYRADSAL